MAYGNYNSTGYRPGYSTGVASATPSLGAVPRRRVIVIPTPAPEAKSESSGGFFSKLFSWKGLAILGGLAGSVFLLLRGRSQAAKSTLREAGETVGQNLDEVMKKCGDDVQEQVQHISQSTSTQSVRSSGDTVLPTLDDVLAPITSNTGPISTDLAREPVRDLGKALNSHSTELDRIPSGLTETTRVATKSSGETTALSSGGDAPFTIVLSPSLLSEAARRKLAENANRTKNSELRKLKKLWKAETTGPLTPQSKEKLEMLKRKYPGKTQEFCEQEQKQLKALLARGFNKKQTPGGNDRLEVLVQRYPRETEILGEEAILDSIKKARLSVQDESIPALLKEEMAGYATQFQDPVNLAHRLDLREYVSLSHLKKNPSFAFTEPYELRWQTLKDALVQRHKALKYQYDNSPSWGPLGWFSSATEERLTTEQSALMKALEQGLLN